VAVTNKMDALDWLRNNLDAEADPSEDIQPPQPPCSYPQRRSPAFRVATLHEHNTNEGPFERGESRCYAASQHRWRLRRPDE
jgi:hypothetical protein